MPYNLFLDDFRMPHEVGNYINPVELRQLYRTKEWSIVRSFSEFVRHIKENGLPEIVSFDHDLVEGHYHSNMQDGNIDYFSLGFRSDYNKTGWHCALWLISYCEALSSNLPRCYVHSMNPIGKENIEKLLNK
jgi:hypothetical protein